MADLIVILDFLSRAMALILAIAAVLGFAFRKLVSGWIDARFKRQLDAELETLKHQLATSLEEKKAELTGKVASELENLKGRQAKDLERDKRTLDEQLRRDAALYDRQVGFYEAFDLEYGQVFAELWALQHGFTTKLNALDPALGPAARGEYVRRVHSKLIQAEKNVELQSAFIDVFLRQRIAKLFADLSKFIANGANDEVLLGTLSHEKGMISAELRIMLLGRT